MQILRPGPSQRSISFAERDGIRPPDGGPRRHLVEADDAAPSEAGREVSMARLATASLRRGGRGCGGALAAWKALPVAAGLLGSLAGCGSDGSSGARILAPGDFVAASAVGGVHGPAAPSASAATERASGTSPAATDAAASGDGAPPSASAVAADDEVPEALPAGLSVPPDDGGAPRANAADSTDDGAASAAGAAPAAPKDGARAAAPAPGSASAGAGRPATQPREPVQVQPKESWIVDGLVGQINGRPVFADEFLDPMADRLRQISQEYDRPEAKRGIMQLVSQRFDAWVDSELIIAEAESLMTPEQKQGVVAWLRDLQEGEILRRGGTRTSAENSLQDQMGVSMDEFLEATRDRAMLGDLLRRRVAPRAIVTWRDMEREYRRRSGEFAPGAKILVGRIALRTATQGDKVALATECFGRGETFTEVAKKLAIPDDGRWLEFKLGEEGIAGIPDLRDDLKAQLSQLSVGGVTPPIAQGATTVWLSLLAKEEPPARSIYERDLQLALRSELQGEREELERQRYIASLRKRWIAEGIEDMRARLIDIALKRYWM